MTPAEFIDNPRWAEAIAKAPDVARTRSVPTHDDCERLDISAVQCHLRAGGTLGQMPGYEERPGQIDMAGAIAAAFNGREHLMIEAGTGVGKSLAYLVPSILWAATNDTTVVISTATRNLQSQLIASDIPRALKILGERAMSFKVALLKGRANYLCLRAVADFFSAGYWTMSPEDQQEMPSFINWLTNTRDGDLDTYDGLPRTTLSCPGEECSGRHCPYYDRCFVYKARKAASEANLVVANHALVLAEATAPGSGILPGYTRLVLDEAHNLEDIATEYLSSEFSMPALTRILNRIIRRRKGRIKREGGLFPSIERQFQKGAFVNNPAAAGLLTRVRKGTRQIVRVFHATEELVAFAERLLAPAGGREVCRYRVDADRGVRCHSLHGLFAPYEKDAWSETDFKSAQERFEAELAALVNLLHDIRDTLDNATPEGEFNYFGDLSFQAGNIADQLVAFANETVFTLSGESAAYAYWAERVRSERRPAYLRLVAAPLSVAGDLRKLVYDVKDSVVLASATLRVGNDFKYMARRLGFMPAADGESTEGRYLYLTAPSPFDYLSQSLALAPDCLPDPSADPKGYAVALSALFRDLFAATHGRALVLFTSYEMMNAVAEGAREPLAEDGITLLVQGEGASRERMTETLRRSSSTVLFGAQSFWEGVDVAGEALSCVVLARLPFAQMGDPIVEARSEKIDREGGSSFRDYSLPEAVIKFRQGFGRLIRTRTDSGVVIVTDPRLVTKNYGVIFRRSIPTSVHTVTELDDLLARVNGFFAAN